MTNDLSHFRKALLCAAVAACAIAVPAQARDGEAYVGVDAGVVFPHDTKIDVNGFNNNAIVVTNGTGFDFDVLGGYDFGILRTEADLA